MKKVFIVFLMVFSMAVTPVFANMPVIDITAITNGITQFMQTVQQYQRQIQQWQSEYERMVKAAKAISSGDFNQIVSGITSFTNQLAKWDSTDKYADDFLRSFGNSAKMTQSLVNASQNMSQSISNSWKFLEKLSSSNPQNLWEGLDLAGDAVFGTGINATKNILSAANVTGKAAELTQQLAALESAAEMLNSDEAEVEKLSEQLAELRDKISNIQSQILEAQNDSEDTRAAQLEASLAVYEKQAADYEEQIKALTEKINAINDEKEAVDAQLNAQQQKNANKISTYTTKSNGSKVVDNAKTNVKYSISYD